MINLSGWIYWTWIIRFGSNRSSGSIVPSPFNISQTGQICTSNYVAEYNQDRFILDIVAREKTSPEREARTRIHVSTLWIRTNVQYSKNVLLVADNGLHSNNIVFPDNLYA